MENDNWCERCGYDRRFENDRRNIYNVMPLGYNQRKIKVEKRSPIENRSGWVRHTRWGSVGPEDYSPFLKMVNKSE